MSKIVYQQFEGGLTFSDRDQSEGVYVEGRELDPFRSRGYILPGETSANVVTSTGTVISGLPTDIYPDPTTDDCYFIDTGNLYHMTSLSNETFDYNFDGSSHAYYDVSGMKEGQKLIVYKTNIGGTPANRLFFAYNTVSAGDVGTYDLSSAFDPDWMSTVPANATALQKAAHDILEWKSYLWIANGQYLAQLDGATGTNGTLNATKLNLGTGWEITKLFPTQNFIGICAWKKQTTGATYRTESRVYFYDGFSDVVNYWIPIEDNKIGNVYNKDGEIILFTQGRQSSGMIRRLLNSGSEPILKLELPISGTTKNFTNPMMNAIDVYDDRIIFASNGNDSLYDFIFSYRGGGITFPYAGTGTNNAYIGAIKTVLNNKIYFSCYDGTNYYIKKIVIGTGNSTNGLLKFPYKDLGQRIIINYIKFYFKPLVSSDSVTVSLDTDYGTANTLGTITYTADGAVTEKKFDVGGIICHSLRPVVDWSVGGVSFSKIVIDYDFIED